MNAWIFVLVFLGVLLFMLNKTRRANALKKLPTEMADKVVWITGASSGLGEALAYRLAVETTCKIILTGRDTARLLAVAKSCASKRTNGKLEDFSVKSQDLEQLSSLTQVAEDAWSIFGKIDYVFLNAGLSVRGSVAKTDFIVDQRLMNVNYYANVILAKALLPKMLKQGSGHFVVISSLQGKFSLAFRSAYNASKHALHGFFNSLAYEVHDRNIHVTLACPGYVNTNLSLNALGSDGKAHGQLDQNTQKGMSAEKCAEEVLIATMLKKREVAIAKPLHLAAVHLSNLFPTAFHYAMVKRGRGESEAKDYS